ncbi:Sphingosine N-acyltransferase lag1 [Coemansia erecta]|uniref:Sphingosine N-acyltransferase lag1 n=1 Tax=Coemansia erecta TaxID=147472 RepID=A0A9W7XUU7_9FUNG|nr:Sphingosine N-acyltransferase lag1 [Coemansia erecta]
MTMVEQPKPQSYSATKAVKQTLNSKKDYTDSAVKRACHWIVDKQIEWTLALLAVIHGHDYFVAQHKSPFVHMKHKIPGDAQGRYYRGSQDVYYILYWVIAFTLVRIVVMTKILEPFAKWWGVRSSRKVTRFAEQGWQTIFYIVSNSAGLYVMSQNPHWMNTAGYWTNYPEGHRQMSALMKSYYLVQMGFWLHQIFVLLIEERRKDFVAMFVHHIVTCTLLILSLYMNYTRVGNAILCCMDFADIFLTGTKCMRYLGFEKLTEYSFVVFLASWIYTRHYLFIKVIYSVMYESKQILSLTQWDPANGSYYSRNTIKGFVALLCTLQLLLIYWLMLMLRIVYRMVFKSTLEDSRSDSESDGEDDPNAANSAKGPSSKKSKKND